MADRGTYSWAAAAGQGGAWADAMPPELKRAFAKKLSGPVELRVSGLAALGLMLLAHVGLQHPLVCGALADAGRRAAGEIAVAFQVYVPDEVFAKWMDTLLRPVPPAPGL